MKAVGYTEHLPIDNDQALIDLELPKPTPTSRDLLVRVQAVSVNPRDIKSRQLFSASVEEPRVLGYDAAGVIEAAGSDVTLFQPGDEVFYAGELQRQGSNAEWQLVDERIVGRKPRSLGPVAAASFRAMDRLHLGQINAANLREAHRVIEGGHTIGKIVLEGF